MTHTHPSAAQNAYLSQAQRSQAHAIAEKHARKHGLTMDLMLGRRRSRRVAIPRQEAMAECWQAGLSNPQVGQFFNHDHTTVVYARKAVKARAAKEAGQ